MNLSRVPEMREAYGQDVMYLIGGALLQDTDIVSASRRIVEAVAR